MEGADGSERRGRGPCEGRNGGLEQWPWRGSAFARGDGVGGRRQKWHRRQMVYLRPPVPAGRQRRSEGPLLGSLRMLCQGAQALSLGVGGNEGWGLSPARLSACMVLLLFVGRRAFLGHSGHCGLRSCLSQAVDWSCCSLQDLVAREELPSRENEHGRKEYFYNEAREESFVMRSQRASVEAEMKLTQKQVQELLSAACFSNVCCLWCAMLSQRLGEPRAGQSLFFPVAST